MVFILICFNIGKENVAVLFVFVWVWFIIFFFVSKWGIVWVWIGVGLVKLIVFRWFVCLFEIFKFVNDKFIYFVL